MRIKKLFLTLCLLTLCATSFAGGITDKHKAVIARGNVAENGATNWAAHANCVFAAFHNSEGEEVDRSGEGGNLTEDGDGANCPTDAAVPSGFGGTSRLFDEGTGNGGDDFLSHADGNSTDITGNYLTAGAAVKTSANQDQNIITKYYTVGNQRMYWLKYDASDDALNGYVSCDGTTICKVVGSDATIDNGTMKRIFMTYDGTLGSANLKLWVGDGSGNLSLDASEDCTDDFAACDMTIDNMACGFGVGGNPDLSDAANNNFEGQIDEPLVMNITLTEANLDEIGVNGIDGSKGGND